MTTEHGKPPSASQVEMTEIVFPADANPQGSAFGGKVFAWCDLAGGLAANRHSRCHVVTAGMDDLDFVRPIRVGQIVILYAQVNAVFDTSMEVGVRVETEEIKTGVRQHVLTVYMTFVALDETRKPTKVVPLVPVTEEDRRRLLDATERRRVRLERRQRKAERLLQEIG